jgi:ABC-type antimicrobial peptide transport system permease subunit
LAGRNPIGLHISYKTDSGRTVSYAIAGVCGDALFESLRHKPRPTWYSTFAQHPVVDDNEMESMNFELRSDNDPELLSETVRKAIREIDPRLMVTDMKTQLAQIDDSIAQDRMFARLSAFFGALALLLAALGLYGTLSYTVSRRTRELGIRMALGARRPALLRMVIAQGLVLVLGGIAAGLIGAALAGKLVASMLFGVQPLDGVSFIGAALLLSTIAAVAAFLPAHRAASIDPTQALRSE